ncbi:MAG: DUF835 domain-containing protein [Thermoplasmata archaeon]|nr:DUF835 domain-containing protein [Thermoplasmata archaeon]
MQLNPYAIAPAISVVFHIIFLAYLLYKSRSDRIRFYFSIIFICVIIWAGAETAMKSMPVTAETYRSVWYYPYAIACGRLMSGSAIALIMAGILLSFQYPVKKISDKQFRILSFVVLVGFLVYMYFALFTPLIVKDVLYYWAGYGVDNGPLFTSSTPILVLIFVIIIYNFLHSYLHARSKVEKMQLRYMTVGALIFIVGVSITGFPDLPPIFGMPTGNFWIIFMDIFWLYAAVKYKLFTIEAVVEDGIKPSAIPKQENGIAPGDSVLVNTKTGKRGFEAFRDVAGKMPGLCITTRHPSVVRTEHNFTKLPIIWISEITTKENAIEPTKLEFEISYHIFAFLREEEKRVVYLDDVDYLIAINGFQTTYEFCKAVADEAAKRNSVFIFSLAENIYSEKERSYFECIKTVRIIETGGEGKKLSSFELVNGKTHLVEISPEMRESIKTRLPVMPTLAISSSFPKKFLKGFRDENSVECIWITETSGYERGYSAKKMEFEVSQEIISFVRSNQGRGLVYIDAVPVFLLSNGFGPLLKFLKDVSDECHEYKASLIVEIPPKLFNQKERTLVERRFDLVFSE